MEESDGTPALPGTPEHPTPNTEHLSSPMWLLPKSDTAWHYLWEADDERFLCGRDRPRKEREKMDLRPPIRSLCADCAGVARRLPDHPDFAWLGSANTALAPVPRPQPEDEVEDRPFTRFLEERDRRRQEQEVARRRKPERRPRASQEEQAERRKALTAQRAATAKSSAGLRQIAEGCRVVCLVEGRGERRFQLSGDKSLPLETGCERVLPGSRLGRALMGCFERDEVEVEAPEGNYRCRILKVEGPQSGPPSPLDAHGPPHGSAQSAEAPVPLQVDRKGQLYLVL